MSGGTFLDIGNPDRPIFRLEQVRHLGHVFEKSELYLASPRSWDDPLEDPIRPYLIGHAVRIPSAFAQSWAAPATLEPLWRRLADRDPSGGVVLGSTPRRLLSALTAWTGSSGPDSCFIGAVEYLSRKAEQARASEVATQWLNEPSVSLLQRARSLLFKRRDFQLEAEVRLLWITAADRRELGIRLPFDASRTVTEVVLDDLAPAIRLHRVEELLLGAGYRGAMARRSAWGRDGRGQGHRPTKSRQ